MMIGSNYTHYAPNPDLGDQPGVLANYSGRRGLCQAQLAQMRENGQTCLNVNLYHKVTGEFAPDGFTLELTDAGGLDLERFTNFCEHLEDIHAAGFTSTIIRFLPASPVLQSDWMREAVFIDGMRAFIKQYAPNPMIDLFAEGTGDAARNLWTWYTTGYGNQDASISCAVSKASIRELPTIFSRNWPTEIWLDLYGATLDPGWGSAYSVLCGAVDTLDAIGVPHTVKVGITETWPFTDQTTVDELFRAMDDRPHWTYSRLVQYPNLRAGDGNNELASPTLAGITHGS